MSKEVPSTTGYKPMTQWAIIPGLALAIVLAVLALLTPVAAWYGVLMPEGRSAPDWFMRSGAVTAVFAFAAQEQAASAIERLSPRGFGSKEINSLRLVFVRPLNWIKRFIFWLAIAGSLIWAYGDIFMLSIQKQGVDMHVQWYLTAVVSLLTLISGVFWIRSATARVLHDPSRRDGAGMLSSAIVDDSGGMNVDVLETAKLQSRWNKWAAMFAGAAALVQSFSSFFFS
ncbi:hypothetical protein K7402_04865 [Pseudomonas fluorescens group sp.]|uniref:Membrane protein n=2 Tax=Pseudomonas fluorescens TaxID=294 RepID=C3KA08_PSEFS|nr:MULTISPECIES: hypothetical protein [Pseudomonas fluorescens group]MBZ6453872.1 hypothetical protein [Pseudomonas fluorescens group sp.]MBZ6459858.1 hypothetical protein [Pseudomonas fluorescens group sp.]MBZ6466749.1 hypothetical protein [Pseudomonas fluorescens group sp.]WQD75035.1 hypothetical protein U0037_14150 [Pseudomonas marginalis]CAI2797054.1 Putative membrane protein [Pseudomonas fluorescens SBW25]